MPGPPERNCPTLRLLLRNGGVNTLPRLMTAAGATSGKASRVAITRAQAIASGVKPSVTAGNGTFWCSWATATFVGRDLFNIQDEYYLDHHLKWCCEQGGNISDDPERWETLRSLDFTVQPESWVTLDSMGKRYARQ